MCLIPFERTLQTMDLINSTIIPFLIMIISTILTVKSVFDSRKKMRQSRNQESSNVASRKRDIKFSITSIALNIIFLILNLPFALSAQIPNDLGNFCNFIVVLLLLLTYINHGTVFFINMFLNTLFFEELKDFFLKY
jgi:hypothetical protein